MNKPGHTRLHQDGDQVASTFCYKISLYFLGIISLLICIIWTAAELNNKIIHYEEIVPEVSFAFDIAGIFFSLSLLVGVHRERLDYMTPYFLTILIIGGYCVAVILTVISRWSYLMDPGKTLVFSVVGLLLALVNFLVVFKYMERLKSNQGIYSTWRRLRGKENKSKKYGGEEPLY
ncbi:unnamed protein product [Allacma fusca]|uniref:Uncharacterized protein n=1 Tax=Allacma fusca TaxID=39272 RepID=A0A8J2LR76_9HEXA|nr:unnamed protein product [Allacma fusca]